MSAPRPRRTGPVRLRPLSPPDETDRAIRTGQHLELLYHDRPIPVTVEHADLFVVEVRPASMTAVAHLPPGTRLLARLPRVGGLLTLPVTLATLRARTVVLTRAGRPSTVQRRRHPRVPVEVASWLTWFDSDQRPLTVAATTRDLSLGGMLVRVPPVLHLSRLPTGQAVLVDLQLPSSPLQLQARVLQAWPDGARICFTRPDAPDHDDLGAFLHPPDGGQP